MLLRQSRTQVNLQVACQFDRKVTEMSDGPRWEEIFGANGSETQSPPPLTRREALAAENANRSSNRSLSGNSAGSNRPAKATKQPKKRKSHKGLIITLISVVVLLGLGAAGAAYAWSNYEPQIRKLFGWEEPIDYQGSGTGSVIITITNGQLGSDVAKTLHESGVTMTFDAFYNLLLKNPDVQFQPGSYKLKLKMSAQAALEALKDPNNKVLTRIGFPEGSTVSTILKKLADLSDSTGVSLEQLQAAAKDFKSFGLPSDAVSLEGYLFPATYSLDPGLSAHDILKIMVDETFKRLDKAGVPAADRNRVLTIASLIQREAGRNKDDFYKVSRVIQNRIEKNMLLQFDSTAHYGYTWAHGERQDDSVFSSSDELKDDNPYNTYVHAGLPIGPIGAPGDIAVDAALHPAEGSWLYFVTVNLDTGETVFSNTEAEHNAAVRQLRDWCRTSQSENCK